MPEFSCVELTLSQTSVIQHCFLHLHPHSDLLGSCAWCPESDKSCFLESELGSASYPKVTMNLVNGIEMPLLLTEP